MSDEFLVDLAQIAPGCPAEEVGGKAANLGRLVRAGLRVPTGFVWLASGGTSQLPQVRGRLREPLVVRSSAALEDGPAGAAAGLFESQRDVTHAGLGQAIAAVLASARTPAARVYADARGVADIPMAVVIQEQLEGRCGVAYTRPPGSPASATIVIELDARDAAIARQHTDDDRAAAVRLGLPEHVIAEVRATCLAAEIAIDAHGGADVEWVFDGERLWLVQARPIVHPRTRATQPPEVVLANAPMGTWHWDLTHNPLPLSPAQAALVRRVDAIGAAPYPMAVIGGYLYCGEARAASTAPAIDATRALYGWQREIMPALDWALAPVRSDPTPNLEAALRAFDQVHEIYVGPLAGLLRAARAGLDSEDDAIGAAGIGAWLGRAARGEIERAVALEVLGDVSLEWDVVAPTFRERPQLLDAAIDGWRGGVDPLVPDTLASVLHRIREEDDLYYFAAQAAVRRALLAIARKRRLAEPSDIFFVDLDDASGLAIDALVARADRARAACRAAATWSMPVQIESRQAVVRANPASDVWRGVGTGGRIVGGVFLLQPGAADPVQGDVIIARSIAPATVVLLTNAAAIVTEHGGLLGHAASIARELDIPCVVGCAGITTHLRTGDQVLVDGQAGLVARVNRSPVR